MRFLAFLLFLSFVGCAEQPPHVEDDDVYQSHSLDLQAEIFENVTFVRAKDSAGKDCFKRVESWTVSDNPRGEICFTSPCHIYPTTFRTPEYPTAQAALAAFLAHEDTRK